MPPQDTLTRTYSAIVHPRSNDADLTEQVRITTAGVRASIEALSAVIAHQTLTPAWLDAWAGAATKADRVRLASLIAASLVGVEPNPPLSAAITGGQDEVDNLLRDVLAEHGMKKRDVDAFIHDQAVTSTPVPPGYQWVSYVDDDLTIPTLGWETLDSRLTGTPTGAPTGALNISCANTISRGMGRGEKTDPHAVLTKAHALIDALADTTLTTVGDLGAIVLPASATSVRDGAAFESWLSEGLAGRAPAPVLLLRGTAPTTPLDGPAHNTGTTTLRHALTSKTREWSRTWTKRAKEADLAAQGGPLAGAWISQIITDATGLAYVSGPHTDILISAAQTLGAHRSSLRQWSQRIADATTALDKAAAAADKHTLEALDSLARSRGTITAYGPVLPAADAERMPDVAAAWACKGPDGWDLDVATALGMTRRHLAVWLTRHPDLWQADSGARLRAALTVHAARRRLHALPMPALLRPTSSHPTAPTFAHGRWRGRVLPDGTVEVNIPSPQDPTNTHTLTMGWSSRRITETLNLTLRKGHTPPTGIPVTRMDTTSLLAADTGHMEAVPTACLDGAAFTIYPVTPGKAAPTEWHMTLSVTHTPPHNQTSAPTRTVMGVSLGSVRDATWTTWVTLPGHTAPDDITTLPKNIDAGIPHPAARIAPNGAPIEFAHPVHEGTIHVGDADGGGWATNEQRAAASALAATLAGLCAPTMPTGDRVRRSDLSAWALATIQAALEAQRTLAKFCQTRDVKRAATLLDTLSRRWALTDAERADNPSAVWGHRRSAINHAIAVKGRTLLPGSGQGLTLDRVIEFDDHLRLMRAAATAPTPKRPTNRRKASLDALGAAMVARRDHLLSSWAGEVASQIVKTALAEGATTIALAANPTAPQPIGQGERTTAAHLAAWARRDVLRKVTSLAPLHGIAVTTVGQPRKVHPITGVNLGLTVAVVPASTAALIHRNDPVWKRQAALAAAHPGQYPLIEQAEEVLAALDAEEAGAKNKDAWTTNAKTVTVHLPHPAGRHLAPCDATYRSDEDPTLSLGAVLDASNLRLGGLQDRGVVAASQVAQECLRDQFATA